MRSHRWRTPTRYTEDGLLEIDNSAVWLNLFDSKRQNS